MRELKYEYLLPIGSIVKVKDRDQKLMIAGVLQCGATIPGKTFDYVALPYPEGMYDSRVNCCFDHNNIEKVIFRGYENDERKAFLVILEIAARAKEENEKKKTEKIAEKEDENSCVR